MATLLVTLPAEPPQATTPLDYALTQDGVVLARHGKTTLPALPQLDSSIDFVTAVIRAEQLSWHQVTLPPGSLGLRPLTSAAFAKEANRGRLRALLDGLLEEHLLDEPQHLHFALAPHARTDEPTWVAVCDKVWLSASIQALERAGRPVTRIVPEFWPQAQSDSLCVVGEPQDARLVFGAPQTGVCVWPASPQTVELIQITDKTTVLAEPAVMGLAESLFQREVALQTPAQRAVAALESPWDLAQFDFATNLRLRRLRKLQDAFSAFIHAPQWQPARWALIGLGVIHLVGLNAWAWHEQRQISSLRQTARSLLTQTFPAVQAVVDAPLQMARQVHLLQQARGVSSHADFETIIQSISAPSLVNSDINAISFEVGRLQLSGVKLNTQEHKALSAALTAKGYTLTQDANSASLQIQEAP